MKTPDIDHPPEETLQAFLLGETANNTETGIRMHLMHCRECRDRAQTLAATLDLLREALAMPIAGAECIPGERRTRIHDIAHKKRKREKRQVHLFASNRSRNTKGKWFTLHMLANVAAIMVIALLLGGLLMPAGSFRSVSEHARHDPTVRSYLFDGPMDQAPPPMGFMELDLIPEVVDAVDVPLVSPDADPPLQVVADSASPVTMRGLYASSGSGSAEERRRNAYRRYLEEYEPEGLAAQESPPMDASGTDSITVGSGDSRTVHISGIIPEALDVVDIPSATPDFDQEPMDLLDSASPVVFRGLYSARSGEYLSRETGSRDEVEKYDREEFLSETESSRSRISGMDDGALSRRTRPQPPEGSTLASSGRVTYFVGQTRIDVLDAEGRMEPQKRQPSEETMSRPSAVPPPPPPPPLPRREPRPEARDDDLDVRDSIRPPPVRFNAVVDTERQPFSTFSIDTDTASFTMARRAIREGLRPDPATVRPEEFINYFDYHYSPPREATFRIETVAAPSPFRDGFATLKIGVRGRGDRTAPPPRQTVLTILIDGSGSMSTPDRIGMVRRVMPLLLEGLRPHDLVTLIRFDRTARLLLPPTPVEARERILEAIETMEPGGSTNLEEGLRVAYATAARHYRRGAANRVLLFSDGVANLGADTAGDILATVAAYRKQGIDLSVFGLGLGTYDDRMLKTLATRGDGSYTYLDSVEEARRVFVEEAAATWHVIARDVRIQVEFDPERVPRYRQIGYEPRQLAPEQFRDDRIDAGEVGYGRSVTALYELVIDSRKSGPLGVVRVRYRDPDSGAVRELEQAVTEAALYPRFDDAPPRFQLAAAVAEWAEWLRGNPVVAGVEPASIRAAMARAVDALPLDDQARETLILMDAGGLLRQSTTRRHER